MYAHFYNNSEHLGKAFLGDPLQLVGGAGGSFVPRSDNAVPEPATFLLCGAAILGFPMLRRLRRKCGISPSAAEQPRIVSHRRKHVGKPRELARLDLPHFHNNQK